jgi:hypothetical protein
MESIRNLTPAEVEAYRRNGWVHAPGLVSRDLAATLLDRARALMGADAMRSTGGGGGDPQFADYSNILRNFLGVWREDPLMLEVSHDPALARNVSRLIHDRPVRFFNDEVLVKPPIERGGKPTPWHQDLPHAAFDRTGMVNIWISLVDLPAEGGAMSFINGSHRFGPLGRTLLSDKDALAEHPWLLEECTVASAPAMKAGDATFHSDMTVHGGPAYEGPHWRWAYLVNLMDASIRYSGGPGYGEKIEGLEANAAFPEDRYPTLYPRSQPHARAQL